jgi:hypothetical protein
MIKDASPPELPGEETLLTETPTPEATSVLVGVFFILFAQILCVLPRRSYALTVFLTQLRSTAIQFVVEEKIMEQYSVAPLVAVGYEGFFGFISIIIFMPFLARFADRSPFFDLPRGWHQITNTPTVLWSSIAVAISISLFNGFGLSVTRHLSATARSVIDTCRTLAIWIISLGLGWESLLFPISLLQMIGFSLLVYGTVSCFLAASILNSGVIAHEQFLFNNLVNPPACVRPPTAPSATALQEDVAGEERALLREEVLEETAALPADLGTSGYDVVPARAHTVAVGETR